MNNNILLKVLKFVINFDNIWKWIGFSTKGNAKTLLTKKFIENKDYLFDRPFEVAKGLSNNQNGVKETILLNVNTFKKLCMKASTKRADDICDYYLKMEMIMYKYTEEKMNSLTLMYEDTKNKLYKFIEYDEELFWNENEISDYNNKNVLYIAFIGIFNNERIYKFGKSEQIYTREFKQHQKFFNIFKMKHVEECDNMSLIEKEFKKNLKSKNLLRNIEIKLNNITELLTISEQHSIDTIINSLKYLVIEYPLPAVKKLRDDIIVKDNEIKIKTIEVEFLKKEHKKVTTMYQLLKIKYDKIQVSNISTESTNEIINNTSEITNEIINEIIDIPAPTTITHIIEKTIKDRHQGPYVQVYDSKDITKLLFVYPSITEATRQVENSSFTQIKFASVNKLVYLTYRWFLVDRTDLDPNTTRDIGETFIHKPKKNGFISMVNKEKDTVMKVFMNQKEASEFVNQCSSAMCVAVKFNNLLNNHYWCLWDTIEKEIQNKYLENNILPIKENTCSSAVRIQQIEPTTNEVIYTFATITEIVKKFGISAKTIKKYSISGEVYGGFKWNAL
jgi:hypothetical protein